jgi:hypothetical protein
MMQHQVAVQARFNPETLERVLRGASSWFSDLLYEYGDGHRRAEHKYRIDRCQPAAGRLTV